MRIVKFSIGSGWIRFFYPLFFTDGALKLKYKKKIHLERLFSFGGAIMDHSLAYKIKSYNNFIVGNALQYSKLLEYSGCVTYNDVG